MAAGRCDDLIGMVRFGRSIVPFSQYVKSYLIKISENLSPKTGAKCALPSVFLYLEGGDALW